MLLIHNLYWTTHKILLSFLKQYLQFIMWINAFTLVLVFLLAEIKVSVPMAGWASNNNVTHHPEKLSYGRLTLQYLVGLWVWEQSIYWNKKKTKAKVYASVFVYWNSDFNIGGFFCYKLTCSPQSAVSKPPIQPFQFAHYWQRAFISKKGISRLVTFLAQICKLCGTRVLHELIQMVFSIVPSTQ